MLNQLLLLPAPRLLNFTGGHCELTDRRLIILDSPVPQTLLFTARRIQKTLKNQLSLDWEIVASPALPPQLSGLTIRIDPKRVAEKQGYRLEILIEGVVIEAHDEAGAFYGICTLVQILQHHAKELPCLEICDWPDFQARGVMLDISRDKVPTLETLKLLVDQLAGWKINQLQLYTEHTFAYRQHPEVWEKASPMTGQDILELDQFCKERFVELVPNQNSFGHMRRWLVHPRYAHLAEIDTWFMAPWGQEKGPFSLCPTDPDSLALMSGLYDELLPHFSSRICNVGCDETFDLGQGRSKEECQQLGQGKVYLDYLLKIYQEVAARGFTMQFWGDMIHHYPELIEQLPKNVIALEWGYESDHPFAEHAAKFAAAGIPFYVCPGTSSWCSIAGRTGNALANLLNAAENGLKFGASGYLITDWGDNGHWQPLPVSLLGFVAGAAYAWGVDENRFIDISEALNRHAFYDRSGVMGCVAFRLGNVYKATGYDLVNASILFSILQKPLAKLRINEKVKTVPFEKILELVDEVLLPLPQAQIERQDRALIQGEFQLVARLLRHACRRGMLALEQPASQKSVALAEDLNVDLLEIMSEYQQIWLARNQNGGLAESLARFEKARWDYLPIHQVGLGKDFPGYAVAAPDDGV